MGCGRNLGAKCEMIIFGSLLPTFKASSVFKIAKTVSKIESSLKLNNELKFS